MFFDMWYNINVGQYAFTSYYERTIYNGEQFY